MTHEDAGHYGAKHPGGKIVPAIADEIREKEKDGLVSCSAAHAIAKRQACSPKVVGMNIDLLEKRICKCQLGLFGYGAKKAKAFEASSTVAHDLEMAIRDSVVDGRITCKDAWDVAQKLNLKKMDISSACEAMEIKIAHCQLGAF